VRAALAAALDRLPSVCALCQRWPARPLCADCRARFCAPCARCTGCARVHPGASARCCACTLRPPPLDLALAAADYAYPLDALLHAFKFQDQPGAARQLAALMGAAPGAQHALKHADLLLPMPLSAQRLRTRGYNQSLLLAHALARDKCRSDVLLRHDTVAQTSLTRAQRLRNVRRAYALNPAHGATVAGRALLLVDDVMTTGASLHAAAQVLRSAGAAWVGALVLARTPG